MITACPLCLNLLPEGASHHVACAEQLFGTSQLPIIEVSADEVPSVIGRLAEKISGVQPKFSAELSTDGTRLTPVSGGRYLVKPPTGRPGLPENEHLTMSLARLAGIQTADFGLVRMADGKDAYVVKRFDRTGGHPANKLDQFDFCQLLDISPLDKYNHNAEQCAQLITKYSSQASADLKRFFQLVVFSYWVGNGDLHLKNLSLLGVGEVFFLVLSPAYDLVCTWVYGDQKLALFVNARQKDLKKADWLALGNSCGIGEEEVALQISGLLDREAEAIAFIKRSALSEQHQVAYLGCIAKRSRALKF